MLTITKIETGIAVNYEIEVSAGEPARVLAEAIGEIMKLDESANLTADVKLVFSNWVKLSAASGGKHG